MGPLNLFRLVPEPGSSQRSQLFSGDTAIGQVDGTVLEAQFQTSRGYLVVTADGNPYEEVIHFHLLNEKMEVADHVSLGRPYHAGILSDVAVGAGDELEFSFFESERWRLVILTQPERVSPRLFAAVRYPRGPFRKHFLRLDRLGA